MEISTVLSVVQTAAIVAGGIFAGVQLRSLNKQRERESALQLLHSFQTREFTTGLIVVFSCSEGLSKGELEELIGDKIVEVNVLLETFESLGILVFRREISLDLVDDFFSGPIVLAWKKLRNYVIGVRQQNNRETYEEWFQWLAEQFEKRESTAAPIPAHIAYRDWTEA